MNFETRDIPFQIKTEHAYEILKQDYHKKNQQDDRKKSQAHGAAFGKHPKFLELKEQLMDIEEEIHKKEEKETIIINKVDYYLTTRTDEEASVNFRLFLHDPHDLLKVIEDRGNLAAGPQAPSARTSNKSGPSAKRNALQKKKAVKLDDTDGMGELKGKLRSMQQTGSSQDSGSGAGSGSASDADSVDSFKTDASFERAYAAG